MKEVFLRVLVLSLTCSALLVPLLLLGKKLRGRYAAKTLYFVWLLLAVRMVLPLPPMGRQASVTVALPAYGVTVPAAPPAVPKAPSFPWNPFSAGAKAPAEEVAAAATQTVELSGLAAAVWAAGVGLFLLWQIAAYGKARRSILRESGPATDEEWALLGRLCADLGVDKAMNLCRSVRVSSPMLLGLLSPMVVLPDRESDPDDLEAVLRHELCHLKRSDVAYKSFFLLVNALHWFNPLVWLMAREAARNVEFCCDDEVLRGADGPTRKHYGEVLLCTAAGSIYPAFSTHFGSGKKQLKERLLNLFRPKKNSAVLVCAVVALALLAGGAVAFESAAKDPPNPMLYAAFALPTEAEAAGGYETVSFHLVEYDPWSSGQGKNLGARALTMADEVRLSRDENGNSMWAGEKGTDGRKRELLNFLIWPLLRAEYYSTTGLIEIVLDKEGKVAQMSWIQMPKTEINLPVPTATATPRTVEEAASASDETIAGLLEDICSAPAHMSNPGAYIEEHREEYDELLGYGATTVDYCFRQFEAGGQTDLRGHIMAALCRELLGVDEDWTGNTGQDWYNAYMGRTEITTGPIGMPTPDPTPPAPTHLPAEEAPVVVDPLPRERKESTAFTLSSGGERGITRSASFHAEAGQALTVTVMSDISGGTVDLFLFSPDGEQEYVTIEGENMTKTITLTEGTWAYNCTGFFESGNVSVVGTVK